MLEQYHGYIPSSILNNTAIASGMNMTQLYACVKNASTYMNAATLLATTYNLTPGFSVVTACTYLSAPQYANTSINLALR